LKPLSEQMGRHPYEIQLEEGKDRVRLKEKLFRLFGYNALEELEGGIGSKYGIFVGYDNGKKAYCGSSELRAKVLEGASKIEWIEIVSIEDEKGLPHLLHEIIEAGPKDSSVRIGEVGERVVILGEMKGVNYQRDILIALSEKAGIPLNVLEDKVEFRHYGGSGEVDGEIIAVKDINVNDKAVFKKGDVIAIVEMESTISGEELEKLCKGACKDLKNHIKLDYHKTVKYGIAIGFSYDPADILAGEPGEILVKVYLRSELEK